MIQSAMNSAYDSNLSRSAVAPVISAGVMMANIIWKAQNESPGSSSAGTGHGAA